MQLLLRLESIGTFGFFSLFLNGLNYKLQLCLQGFGQQQGKASECI